VAKFDRVIPSGQTGKVEMELDGKQVHGHFRKSASIFSNDPKNPKMTITLSGDIVRYLDVLPSDRIYLRGMFGEKVEKQVVIVSNEKKPIEVLKLESNIDDKITYKLIPSSSPDTLFLKVWKNPNLPTMKTWGSITLHTKSENTPQKVIQVNVVTTGAILVRPTIVNFGQVNANKHRNGEASPIEKIITVSKAQGSFLIKDVSFSSKNYIAEVETIENGKSYKVSVRFAPQEVKRHYSDEMIINTDDPQEPSVRVRLIARSL
jgi:hypothetical protein